MKKINLLALQAREAVHFGRWVLKYCEIILDKGGYLTYTHRGNEYTTSELYLIFKSNPYD